MIVVSDTSVLFYAIQLGAINFFHDLFDTVIIPPSVANELEQSGDTRVDLWLSQDWVSVVAPEYNKLTRQLRKTLDPGESEAIALTVELEPDLLLIDEMAGRNAAISLNLKITGLLGIFLLAKANGLIPAIKPWLEKLQNTNFRASTSVYKQVLLLANES